MTDFAILPAVGEQVKLYRKHQRTFHGQSGIFCSRVSLIY